MRFTGFIGPSYTLQSLSADCQRTVNLYPEMNEIGTEKEKEVGSLVSTPGLKLLVTLPQSPVRGVYADSLGNLWAVGGNTLYSISSSWIATSVGALKTGAGPVSFADNGFQLVIVDGSFGYFFSIQALSSTNTATAAGTTTLTSSSTSAQIFTGSSTQTVVLPSVNTLNLGTIYYIENKSSGNVTVNTSDSTLAQVIAPNSLLVIYNNATTGSGLTPWVSAYSPNHVLGSTFIQITDPNFLGADQVTYMDGYFIFNKPGTQFFYLSPLRSVVPLNSLDTGSAEACPDNIIGHIAVQQNLYLFGGESTEIFYDSGNNSFPFQRIQGAVMEYGCAAAFSIQKIQNMVFWLGKDRSGRGVVYRAQGLQPERISNYAIENQISNLGSLSGARAWTYQKAGHSFYCLNIPGSNTTWVFDASTKLWHERTSLVGLNYQRHLAECHALAFDTNVVGDYTTGNVYSLDSNTYSDNGNPILRERTSPHLSKDLNKIFHSSFNLDMETGVGLSGITQGTDPQVMLQWSDDFANTWSNEHWKSAGSIGQRRKRVIWRRLGQSRDRVYRVRISDPVKVTILGAEIGVEEGAA